MITNQEQRDNELLYLLSEGLSEYLQGYKLEQGGPAFDTLETASLNLTPEFGRQGFENGGGIGNVFSNISDTVSEISSNVPAAAQAAIGFAATTAAKGLSPLGVLGLGIDLASVVFSESGKTATGNIMGAITNPAAHKGSITYGSYPTGLEEDTPPGTTTTQADRQANIAETGTATGLGTSISGAQGQQFGYSDIDPTTSGTTTDPNTDFPDDPQEVDVTPGETVSTPDIADESQATADTSGEADASSDASADASVGDYGGAQGDSALQKGGQIKGYQEGDLVAPEQTETQLDALGLGPTGLVNDPDGEVMTGVADDLEMELEQDSYVLNADTVSLVGVRDLNTIVKDAINVALESGMKLPREVDPTKKVPIRISRNEFVVPAPLASVIGFENLEKMNARGLRHREQREKEEAPVQMAAAPSPQEDLLAQIQPVA